MQPKHAPNFHLNYQVHISRHRWASLGNALMCSTWNVMNMRIHSSKGMSML